MRDKHNYFDSEFRLQPSHGAGHAPHPGADQEPAGHGAGGEVAAGAHAAVPQRAD